MSYGIVDFFSSISEDVTYFDEGPVLHLSQSTDSSRSGIDTTMIDGFRQGVEITLTKHYTSGTAKIYAGEQGHVVRQNNVGLTRTFVLPDVGFTDMQTFDAAAYVSTSNTSYPIIIGDGEQQIGRNGVLDGIIEPLTIRAKVGFFSIDVPFEAHDVRGTFGGGNSNQFGASEQVLFIDYVDQSTDAKEFVDLVDMFEGKVPLNGYFNVEQVQLLPFSDESRTAQSISSAHDASMQSALTAMVSGSTENFIQQNQRSASAGWYYDNGTSPRGTDSIAFGGLSY